MSASIGLNAQTVTKNDIILKYTDILTSSGDSLLEINQNTKYLNYNFSDILKPRRILGIIGDNYQRLQIKFLSIKKMKVIHQNILFAGNPKSIIISAILKEKLSLKKYTRLFVSDMYSMIYIKTNILFRKY